MLKESTWNTITLAFRQTYTANYRYLDKCGEFMEALLAIEDFVPKEEVKPTGCAMIFPEKGLDVTMDALSLLVQQSVDCDTLYFQNVVTKIVTLTHELLQPRGVERNGVAIHLLKPSKTEKESTKEVHGLWDKFEDTIAEELEMEPHFKNIDYHFLSGSYKLNVKIAPAFYRSPPANVETRFLNDTSRRRKELERLADLKQKQTINSGFGLLCQLDLTEDEPAEQLAGLFEYLKERREKLFKHLPK